MMKISISWTGLLLAAQDVIKALGMVFLGISALSLIFWLMWLVVSWLNEDWIRVVGAVAILIFITILVPFILDARRERIDRDRE
jgi:hypothetical protein